MDPALAGLARYAERAREQFSGRPVSAVGWDFDFPAMAPREYRHLS